MILISNLLGIEVPTPKWELLPHGGLVVTVENQNGLTEVDLHFSINKEVHGVEVGDFNEIIR